MARISLKDHSSFSQVRTVQRASERVSSWPQWKRSTILYRSSEPAEPAQSRELPAKKARATTEALKFLTA